MKAAALLGLVLFASPAFALDCSQRGLSNISAAACLNERETADREAYQYELSREQRVQQLDRRVRDLEAQRSRPLSRDDQEMADWLASHGH